MSDSSRSDPLTALRDALADPDVILSQADAWGWDDIYYLAATCSYLSAAFHEILDQRREGVEN